MHPVFLIASIVLSAFPLESCLHRKVSSKVAGFETQKSKMSLPSKAKLQNLKAAFKKADYPDSLYSKIVIRAEQELITSEFNEPGQNTNLRFYFGKIDEKQCEIIRHLYADGYAEGLSGVNCSTIATKNQVELVDFLLPAMQATMGKVLIDENLETNRRPLTASEKKEYNTLPTQLDYVSIDILEANCWSTLFEMARFHRNLLTVHQISESDALKYFVNETYTALKNAPGKQTSKELLNLLKVESPQFGDLLLVYAADGSILFHGAMFIDRDILFEKTGPGSTFLYRVVELKDILTYYGNSSFDVRRVVKQFPHISETNPTLKSVGESDTAVYEYQQVFRDVTLIKDKKTGRFDLSVDAYKQLL